MKKLSILTAAGIATSLGFATLATPAYAAGETTLTQSDFASAYSSLGTNVNGVTCASASGGYYCVLDAGNYLLGEDINLTNLLLIPPMLLLNQNVTIDLNSKTITGAGQAVQVRDARVTLKNGTIASTNNNGVAINSSGTSASSTNLTLDNITVGGGTRNNRAMFGLGIATVKDCNLRLLMATDGGALTLNNDTIRYSEISQGVNLTINSGTYGNPTVSGLTDIDPAMTINDSNVTINGGTFISSQATDAITVDRSSSSTSTHSTVTINGGTFTSINRNGVEFTNYKKVTVNGGTFTGKNSGITLPYNSDFTISGGTFKATGTGELDAAIQVSGTADTSNAENLLAANHRYTNASVVPKTIAGLGGGDYLLIGGAETSVVANSSASTTGSSSTDAGISAPKSGVMTSETGSAVASLAPAAIIALGGAVAFALAKSKKED